MRKGLIIVGTLLLFFIGGGMFFSPRNGSLKLGDEAPDFTLTDQNGSTVKMSDFRGRKNIVLAFYIKAFTSG